MHHLCEVCNILKRQWKHNWKGFAVFLWWSSAYIAVSNPFSSFSAKAPVPTLPPPSSPGKVLTTPAVRAIAMVRLPWVMGHSSKTIGSVPEFFWMSFASSRKMNFVRFSTGSRNNQIKQCVHFETEINEVGRGKLHPFSISVFTADLQLIPRPMYFACPRIRRRHSAYGTQEHHLDLSAVPATGPRAGLCLDLKSMHEIRSPRAVIFREEQLQHRTLTNPTPPPAVSPNSCLHSRILKEDVLRYLKGEPHSPAPAPTMPVPAPRTMAEDRVGPLCGVFCTNGFFR